MRTILVVAIAITMTAIGCSARLSSSERTNRTYHGFWKAEDGSYWVFKPDGSFFFGKKKDKAIRAFICGTYQIEKAELKIHDSLGNDLIYDLSFSEDRLLISTSNGTLNLTKAPNESVESDCQGEE